MAILSDLELDKENMPRDRYSFLLVFSTYLKSFRVWFLTVVLTYEPLGSVLPIVVQCSFWTSFVKL